MPRAVLRLLVCLAAAAGAHAADAADVSPVDPRVVALLAPALAQRETALAEWAARPDEAMALSSAWATSKDPVQRALAARLAAAAGGLGGLPGLVALQRDREAPVRRAVALALAALPRTEPKTPAQRQVLELASRLLDDPDHLVRATLVRWLAPRAAEPGPSKLLLQALGDASDEVADQALAALAAAGSPKLMERVASGLASIVPRSKVLAANHLARLGGPDAVIRLVAALPGCAQADQWEARAAICDALAAIGPEDPASVAAIEPRLLPLLKDPRWGVRCASAWALGRIGSRALVPALLAGGDPIDAEPFRGLLRAVTGQPWQRAEDWRSWWRQDGKAFTQRALPAPTEVSRISFWSLEEETRNVVFVIDRSGSMVETGRIAAHPDQDAVDRTKLDMRGANCCAPC